VFPIIFIVIIGISIYRFARDNGYNAVMWTAGTVVGFVLVQFVSAFTLGLVLAFFFGWSAADIEGNDLLFSLVSLIPGVILAVLAWKHVNVIRDDGVAPQQPPPPPSFPEQ